MQLIRDRVQPTMPTIGGKFGGSADVYLLSDDEGKLLSFPSESAASETLFDVEDSEDYSRFASEYSYAKMEVARDANKYYYVRMPISHELNGAGDVIPIYLPSEPE